MWIRSQLKEKGKGSFKANYWKAVLVALILVAVASGGASVASLGGGSSTGALFGSKSSNQQDSYQYLDDQYFDENYDSEEIGELIGDLEDYGINVTDEDGNSVVIDENGIDVTDEDGNSVTIGEDGVNINGVHSDEFDDVANTFLGIGGVVAAIVLFFIALICIALAILIDAFLLNPLEVGGKRFFLCNLNRKADVKEVAFAYDHNYLVGVKTMFLRDLFICLWTLLFIIPGIVKSYEYRMIPYLIAENPELDYKQAFALSKQMMTGQKWRTFVLDLSFIGWWILSGLTLGILGLFYVQPYYEGTCAALYEALRYGNVQAANPAAVPAAPAPAAAPAAAEAPATPDQQ